MAKAAMTPTPKTAARPQSTAVATKARDNSAPAVADDDFREAAISTDMRQVPDFMQDYMGRGMENVGRDELAQPFLTLIHPNAKIMQIYDQLEPGFLFHTSAEKMWDIRQNKQGAAPLRVVPIYQDTRYTLWNPRDSGGGILARADDGVNWSPQAEFTVVLDKKDGGHSVVWDTRGTVEQSGLWRFGTKNPKDPKSTPAAMKSINFLVGFPDYPDLQPGVLVFQSGSIKVGRTWNSKMASIRAPKFGLVFEINSFMDQNKKGDQFYNLAIRGAGVLQDEDLFLQYEALNKTYTDAGVKIDMTRMEQEDEVGSEADNAPERSASGRAI